MPDDDPFLDHAELWRVPVLGPLDDEAIGRLDAAGITIRATSEARRRRGLRRRWASESHGLYVRASTAEAAAGAVSAILHDVPVYVAGDEASAIEE